MISVVTQASINLCLNSVLFALISLSLFQNFFSFLDFRIGLKTITHLLQYEDVRGNVYTTFYNFESFACGKSEIDGIRTVCGNIINFEVAGIIYLIGAVLLLFSIGICILNLLMILLMKGNALTKIRIPHFLNAGVYILIATAYFLISNIDHLEPPNNEKVDIQAEFGLKLLYINSGLAIFTLLHYTFIKKFTNLDNRMQLCFNIFSNLLGKLPEINPKTKLISSSQSEPLDIQTVIQDKVGLENTLKEKEVEIQTLYNKVKSIEKQMQTPGDEEIVIAPASLKAKKTQKVKLRSGKGQQRREEIVENPKEEDLQGLLQEYTEQKDKWEQEKKELLRKLEENPDRAYAQSADRVKNILEEINNKLEEKIDDPEDRKKIQDAINQIKNNLKRPGSPEEMSWEQERNSLNDVINTLSVELEKARSQGGNTKAIVNENKRLAQENSKLQDDKKNMQSYINELEIRIDEIQSQPVSKPLLSQDQETSAQTRSLINSYKAQSESQQEEIDRLTKALKQYKDQILQNEANWESSEKKIRDKEYQIRNINERLEEQKALLDEKEEKLNLVKKERDETKRILRDKEDELEQTKAQLANLQREISILKQSSAERKSDPEIEYLTAEKKALEERVSQLSADLNNQNQENKLNILKSKEELAGKDQLLEEEERKNRLKENKIKGLNENLEEMRNYLEEKDNVIAQVKKERDEAKKRIKENEEEINNLTLENSKLTRENILFKNLPEGKIEQTEAEAIKVEKDFLNQKLAQVSQTLKEQREAAYQMELENGNLAVQNSQLMMKIQNTEDSYNQLQRDAEDLSKQLEDYDKIKKKLSEKENLIDELSLAVDQYKKQISELKEKIRELQEADEEKSYFQQQTQKLKESLEATKSSLHEAESKNAELYYSEEARQKLQTQNEKLNQLLDTAKSQISENQVLAHQKESEWLAEKDKLLENLSQQRKDAEEEKNNLQQQIQKLKENLETAKSALREAESKNTEIFYSEESRQKLQTQNEKLNKLLEAAKSQISDSQVLAHQKESEWLAEKDKLLENISQQRKEAEDLHRSIKSKDFELEEMLKTAQEEKEMLHTQVSKLADLLKLAKDKLLDYDNRELAWTKEKEELKRRIDTKEKEKQEIEQMIANMKDQSEDSKKSIEEKLKLQNLVSKLTEDLNATRKDLEESVGKSYRQESDWEKEKNDLMHLQNQLKKEVEQLHHRMKNQEDFFENELQSSQLAIEKLKDDCKDLKTQAKIHQDETSRLNQMKEVLEKEISDKTNQIQELSQVSLQGPSEVKVKVLEEQVSDIQKAAGYKVKILEEQVADLQSSLNQSENRLQSVIKEKDELRNELSIKHSELQSISEECQNMHDQLYEIGEKQRTPKSPDRDERFFNRSREGSLESSSHSAQDLMIIEGLAPSVTQNNPLLENVSNLRREPPMTYSNVWKLFEALMQDKCKLDRLEMALGRQPRTMTEYMLDFVYLHYGLKALALKQLKALITSLEQLYKIGHPYGVLFCRFLGLFHPRPLPYQVSIYALIVQEQFSVLTTKIKEKPANFTEQYEILQFGGVASIVDVMDLIMKICRNNREAGERIIMQLHRDRPDKLELTILKVCGTMARMGKSSDYIFEVLDIDQGGSIDYQTFIDGIRFTLNIWITQEEGELLCAFIDEQQTGLISYIDWYQKINFVEFAEKMYSKVAMITKADFLNALVDEYEYEVVQDYYQLRQMIRFPSLDMNSVLSLLMQIDPSLDEEEAMKLYNEAREHERDVRGYVSPEAFCIIVLKNRVGGYGIGMFDVYALDQGLPKISSEGVKNELVVERDYKGKLEVDIRKKSRN
ncbi:unnamed protein product [Blepharisma stoltei]|uniref:Uncharacterized protein n=1 Tax=Blepharisma stoltei TaxID=1481888 RepID=A0AAU9JVC8_9CILI|nr:unnamed protein product [Blepharisma stoltei]